jgi:hypothetical protein
MSFFDALKDIPVPAQFGIYEEESDLTPSSYEYETEIYIKANELGVNIKTAYGCSQFVIIVNDNEVYKIPFNGVTYANYEDSFELFDRDYADETVALYDAAVEEGVDKVFANTRLAGYSCNGYPIYTQTYAKPYLHYCDNPTQPTEDSKRKAKKISREKYIPFTNDWFALAIDQFGLDYMIKVLEFIDDFCISDLHRNNYGYTAEGHVIIFDYAGFDEY